MIAPPMSIGPTKRLDSRLVMAAVAMIKARMRQPGKKNHPKGDGSSPLLAMLDTMHRCQMTTLATSTAAANYPGRLVMVISEVPDHQQIASHRSTALAEAKVGEGRST